MDIHSKIRSSMGHETTWNPSTTRRAKIPRRCLAALWQNVSVCGCDPELLPKLCGALGPELSPGRQRCSPAQPDARAFTAAVAAPEAQAATSMMRGHCLTLHRHTPTATAWPWTALRERREVLSQAMTLISTLYSLFSLALRGEREYCRVGGIMVMPT